MISPEHIPSALVTGATGAIGHKLVHYLLRRGYHVRVLVRNIPPSLPLPADVDVFHGNINDSRILGKAVGGVDVVFHLAAKLHANKPCRGLRSEYELINVEGTQRLVNAVNSAKVDRLIFFSTINVYGKSQNDSISSEGSPINPESLYAGTKAKAEKIVLEHSSGVVLRLAAVYGPGMKGNYLNLLKFLNKGCFFTIGDGLNRRTLIYIDDACRAAVLAAEHPESRENIYNVTDGGTHTLKEITGAICEAIGRKPPFLNLPISWARTAFGIMEDAMGVFKQEMPIGRHTVDKFVGDIAVSGDKIQKELGFEPRYDLKKGWENTVRRMRSRW